MCIPLKTFSFPLQYPSFQGVRLQGIQMIVLDYHLHGRKLKHDNTYNEITDVNELHTQFLLNG
jgi:hypothetical protein